MYLQVLVHPDDYKLQTIFYRSTSRVHNANGDLWLKGSSISSHKISCIAGTNLQPARNSEFLQLNFYVDDRLKGAETEEKCYQIYCKLTEVLCNAYIL